jgi:hypothetical protein
VGGREKAGEEKGDGDQWQVAVHEKYLFRGRDITGD